MISSPFCYYHLTLSLATLSTRCSDPLLLLISSLILTPISSTHLTFPHPLIQHNQESESRWLVERNAHLRQIERLNDELLRIQRVREAEEAEMRRAAQVLDHSFFPFFPFFVCNHLHCIPLLHAELFILC
jgi:hypothetical protein